MTERPKGSEINLDAAWEAAGEFPSTNLIEEFKDRNVEVPTHIDEYQFRQDKQGLYVLHKPCGDLQVRALYDSFRRLAEILENHAISCQETRREK